MSTIFTRRFVLPSLVLALLFLGMDNAFARAGGGGGLGGAGDAVGGGILVTLIGLIIAPFYIAWMLIKKAKTKVTDTVHDFELHRAAGKDPFWDEDAIKARVEKTFFTVQRAWMKRDQEIAREFVTDRLYNKHKMQTDLFIEQQEINMLQNINLIEIQTVKVDDRIENRKDKLWVRIRGSMIDFTISEKDGRTKGSSTQPQEFTEVWKFTRGATNWLLDEIDQNVDQN